MTLACSNLNYHDIGGKMKRNVKYKAALLLVLALTMAGMVMELYAGWSLEEVTTGMLPALLFLLAWQSRLTGLGKGDKP